MKPPGDRFLSRREVEALGLAAVGRDVLIDRDAALLRPNAMRLDDRVRIDRGALISAGDAGVSIGYNTHIAAGVLIYGGGGPVTIGPMCNLSSLVRCYTISDDFRGDYLAGATIPEQFRNVTRGAVTCAPCALVGSAALILPGVTLGEGSVVSAHTVVTQNLGPGEIVVGQPQRTIGNRSVPRLRELWRAYLASIGESDRWQEPAVL